MFFRRWNFRIWRTQPFHLFDVIFWWLIKLVWEPFSLKRSHWWHWQMRILPESASPLEVTGDELDIPRNTKWRVFFLTNFGWHKVALIAPVEPRMSPYQVGWNQACNPKFKENEFEICTIALCSGICLLVGPGKTNFFGFDMDGNPIELKVAWYTTKKEAFKRGYEIY